MIVVGKINETFLQLSCEKYIAYELNEYFSFKVPGCQYHPKYRAKMWDGKIRLFNLQTGQLYFGLYSYLKSWMLKHNYEYKTDILEINTKSLYLKDDDYRLSFLYGNFTTLTRFTESDLERVLVEFRAQNITIVSSAQYKTSNLENISGKTTNGMMKANSLRRRRRISVLSDLEILPSNISEPTRTTKIAPALAKVFKRSSD